jgi:hypothetical protein
MPKTVMAIKRRYRIALSPSFICFAAIQDNARTGKNENEV